MPQTEQPKLWLSLREVLAHLDQMGARAFREYLDAGLFPRGLVAKFSRKAKNKRIWTTEDLDWMIYVIRNQHRFRPKKQPPQPQPKQKRDGAN